MFSLLPKDKAHTPIKLLAVIAIVMPFTFITAGGMGARNATALRNAATATVSGITSQPINYNISIRSPYPKAAKTKLLPGSLFCHE